MYLRFRQYEEDTVVSSPRTCGLLWERLYLWYDGTVNPCDIDHLSTLSLGNVNHGDSISKLWNGKEMEELRKTHLCNRKEIVGVCARCSGY